MLAAEEVLSELNREDVNEQGLPPGFRFHPTDEELITFYLASKVFKGAFCGIDIAEVDLNRCEPWELPDVAKMGEKEWYFYSLRDRKYPTGLRTNRATGAGYWKATGKDREVCSASNGALLGMKKTLVFYKGRAPRGEKTKWVMHEYRLDGDFSYRHTCKEEWVICRIFHKAVEKKSAFQLQGQSCYLMEAEYPSSPMGMGSLPPLLDTQTTTILDLESCHESQNQNHYPILEALGHHNPFMIHDHHENDLKTLINQSNILFPINGFQTQSSFSSTITNTTNKNIINNNSPSSPSMIFKSLLSNQDFPLKEQLTIPKHCKTEANFSHFQLPDSNNNFSSWMDKFQQNPYQNSLFFETDCGDILGLSQGVSTTSANDMSTLVPFNRAGFQVTLDNPIRLPGESWPLDA